MFHSPEQGILKWEVSLYCWPPVWLVWNQLYDYWQFLVLFAKQTNPNQSNRRSAVQWYFPNLGYPPLVFPGLAQHLRGRVRNGIYNGTHYSRCSIRAGIRLGREKNISFIWTSGSDEEKKVLQHWLRICYFCSFHLWILIAYHAGEAWYR